MCHPGKELLFTTRPKRASLIAFRSRLGHFVLSQPLLTLVLYKASNLTGSSLPYLILQAENGSAKNGSAKGKPIENDYGQVKKGQDNEGCEDTDKKPVKEMSIEEGGDKGDKKQSEGNHTIYYQT